MATIMVLDDDRVILELLQTVLTDAGYDTIVAATREDMPAQASVDLVITDLFALTAYRREDALRWVASLRSRFGDVPVFVLTGHRAATAETDGLGADAIISKPFDVEFLLGKISEVLG
jgi:DNA-binding response OmpR family regulator